MTDIAQHRATAAPAATMEIAAAIATGQVKLPDPDIPWPNFEALRYVTKQDGRTASFVENSLAISIPSAAEEFGHQIASIHSSVSSGQEPLGADFEAVWDRNVSRLYES